MSEGKQGGDAPAGRAAEADLPARLSGERGHEGQHCYSEPHERIISRRPWVYKAPRRAKVREQAPG